MYIRFQQEEARIQAWESNEKAKAEAEMRKIEVYIFFPCLTCSMRSGISFSHVP